MIASELNRTNEMIESSIGLNYEYFYNAENYDTIKFGNIVRELDKIYVKIIDSTGGFKPGYAEVKLFDPTNKNVPNYYLLETDLLVPLRAELTNSIDAETNQLVKDELIRMRDDIFGNELANNTATEFRLRYLIAKNRLYLIH